MTKLELLNLIKQRLGDRSDPGIDARILSEVDLAQFQLENGEFVPWFLLSEDATYITTPGEARIPLPTDMLMEYDEGALYYGTSELIKRSYDQLRAANGDSTGVPQQYAVVGDYFVLGPAPDDAYTLTMKYWAKDELISSLDDIDQNKWLKHAPDWILAKAGGAVARFIKDMEALQLFAADEKLAHQRVYIKHIAWEEANLSRVMEG